MRMTSREGNELVQELIAGLPITLVVPRLLLRLRAVLDGGGEPADTALRQYCDAMRRRDDAEEWDLESGWVSDPRD